MIKIENVVLPSPDQWKAIIFGARNPMNSWDKSDSETKYESWHDMSGGEFVIGPNDHELMMKLSRAGTDHRKFMRMIDVYLDITAPLYWWKEFDTYKVGTVANSCSTMHKIHSQPFGLSDFSLDKLNCDIPDCFYDTLDYLNESREKFIETKDKKYWWQMIQLLPSSYDQRRTIKLNYEVLANIYKSRKNHKLDEWRDFCKWIESLPYSELITGEEK